MKAHHTAGMKILFIFMDGVGLGEDNAQINPFSRAELQTLSKLLDGRRLLASSAPCHTPRATLIALDPCLGVKGMPQSATGQTTLLTGKNLPAELGYHYGPKPNATLREYLTNGNLLSQLVGMGKRVSFLNAYPPGYFHGIDSGKRLRAAFSFAATCAGIKLRDHEDLFRGEALSADFTGEGWRNHLQMIDTPLLTPYQAGVRLHRLASQYDFSLFEYWLSDYVGHRQDMEMACKILEEFDQVLQGLLDSWKPDEGLILITSDHGNLEDLSTRRHTINPVPALCIGDPRARQMFCQNLYDLTGIAPAILRMFSHVVEHF